MSRTGLQPEAMREQVRQSLRESIRAKEELAREQMEDILALVGAIVSTFQTGSKLLIFGNGGSAADAQHLAAEFVNRFLIDRPPLPAIALTTDSSILTSVGNDFSFDLIFAKQLLALGNEGDLALAISTSGNSPNVIEGLETARAKGMRTAGLSGGSGGRMQGLADLLIVVPSTHTPAIQEAHLWVEHLLCQLVDEALYGL